MKPLDNYLNNLNEEIAFMTKFKASFLKKIADKMKKSVKGNKVDISTLKATLKPIPAIGQDKINKLLNRYVPNYQANYNVSKKHFDKKYTTNQNNDAIASMTAAMNAVDQKRSLQDTIKNTDKVYSKAVLMGIPGGAIVALLGTTVILAAIKMEAFFDTGGGRLLAIVIGVMMIISGVLSTMQRG